jgi:hypothetical protein
LADTKITDLASINGADIASTDVVPLVDVSDTTMAASGTNKRTTITGLTTAVVAAGGLATTSAVTSAVSAHEADTTSVHGIADTSALLTSVDVPGDLNATGTPSASTFLRGDGAWATPASGSVATDAIFDAKGDLVVGTGADTASKLTAGSGGQFLVPNSNQSTGMQWVGPFFQIPAAGEYLACQFATGLIGFATAATLNRVEFCPVWVPARSAFDRITFFLQTTGTSGAVARLGIYAASAAGKPGALVLDAGTVATDAGGSSYKEITISVTLDPGLYYLALVTQTATCTPRNVANLLNLMNALGGSVHGIGNTSSDFYVQTGVTGALPNPATPVSTGNGSNRGPFSVGLRAA